MKKSIMVLVFIFFAFVGCTQIEVDDGDNESHFLLIRNNTEENIHIEFGHHLNGIRLKAGQAIEVSCGEHWNLLTCNFGLMSFEPISNDTTLEINSGRWYLGETEKYYNNDNINAR